MPAVTPLVPEEQPISPERASPAAGPATAAVGGCQEHRQGHRGNVPDLGSEAQDQDGPARGQPSRALSGTGRGAGPSPGASRILGRGARSGRLTHRELIPARAGRRADWPAWAPGRADRSARRGRSTRPVGSSGGGSGPRPRRAERDHLDGNGIGKVDRLPAPRADRRAGGQDQPVHRADQGARRRSAAHGAVPGPARRARRGHRRRHPGHRALLGPGTRQLPAHDARHAAPYAAAAPFPVGRLPPAAAVRDRR